jgi:hypothetical protein
MKSSPKGSAESLKTTADYFTQEGGAAVDSVEFTTLPDAAQEELLALLSAAMLANGW